MIVQVLGRTVSLVSDIPGDLAGTECLIGHQLWEPLSQVLFSEVVNILDEGVLLLMTGKDINRKNFFVGELRFRIIAPLAMVFEALFVHIADIHIDFYFVLRNHNKQKIGIFFLL